MRGSFASFGRSTVAAAALLASGAIVSLVVAAPVMAKDKEAPKATNSAEFSKGAGPFQKTFGDVAAKKGKVSDDEFKTAAAGLIPALAALEPNVKSPLDRLIYGDWQRQIGGWANDNALLAKGLQNMLDSGQLQANLVPTVSAMLGQIAYVAKDYPTAIKVLTPLMSNPGIDDAVPQMLAEAYASANQPKQGLDALKTAIAARKAAGREAPEEWYSRGNRIAYTAKMTAESTEWALLLVAAYPTPINWLGATQLVRNGATNFGSPEELDVSRLMDQTGALKLEPKYVEREYVAYLQAIDARRFPGEAVRIAEQGIATGALKPDDTFVKDSLTQARPRVAADKASLPGLAKEAAASPSGKVALAAGDTYLSYADAAQADAMYTLALSKGGVDADKDRLLTRLGIAQIDEGKFTDAKATLAKVTGPRMAIAQLWSIYADQKAAGK
jgi:energy-converting hydrogenase Eha subunit A